MIRKVPRLWTGVPNFPGYMINESSEVMRVMRGRGTQSGRILKPTVVQKKIETSVEGVYYYYDYYQIVLSKDGKNYTRSLRKLAAQAFTKHVGYVRETKIRKESGSVIKREKTRLITENINGNPHDLKIENIRWNFPKRGERHPNHKLNNNVIQLIRNNLDMDLEEFISRYGGLGVTRGTIQSVLRGKSWRVRVEPFSTMTYPGENYVG